MNTSILIIIGSVKPYKNIKKIIGRIIKLTLQRLCRIKDGEYLSMRLRGASLK